VGRDVVAVDYNMKAVDRSVLTEGQAAGVQDAPEAAVAMETPGALEVTKKARGIGDLGVGRGVLDGLEPGLQIEGITRDGIGGGGDSDSWRSGFKEGRGTAVSVRRD
jgi:hypothetical protein